jgi:hypothetical protein
MPAGSRPARTGASASLLRVRSENYGCPGS